MKQKLFGLALMLAGGLIFCWHLLIILLRDGLFLGIFGAIPLVAGWIIFHQNQQSPTETQESFWTELKTGCARIRAWLKGLL